MRKSVVSYLFSFITLLICCSGCTIAQKKSKANVANGYVELEIEKLPSHNIDEIEVGNYKQLLQKADKLLTVEPFSVVNKKGVPPSNSKHDYMSIGPYWWPNPDTENGLPYLRKDGEINPESRNDFTDYVEKNNFISAVKILHNAYSISGKKIYADKNIELIDTWFLDEKTKMNPNVNFGQYIPGKTDGRCFGIIEFAGLIEVVRFLELAKSKGDLNPVVEQGMFNWFTEYSNWLSNSKLGKEEATRKNNHGTHYDVQLLNILSYLNRDDEVKEYLSTITIARVFSQIEADGSQPLELARTKSFSYSAMNLHAFLQLANLGKNVGVDLWNQKSKEGKSIKAGFQFMLPYLLEQKEWNYPQIIDRKQSEEKLIADLKYAKEKFNETCFDNALKEIEIIKSDKKRIVNNASH